MVNNALDAAQILSERGIDVSVIRLTKLCHSAENLPEELFSGCKCVVVLEEVCAGSGIYESIAQKVRSCNVSAMDLGHRYATHGSINSLYKHYGLDAISVANYLEEVLKVEN